MRADARSDAVAIAAGMQLQGQRRVQAGHRQGHRVESLHVAGWPLRRQVPRLAAPVQKPPARAHRLWMCHSLLVRQEQVSAAVLYVGFVHCIRSTRNLAAVSLWCI